jgi:uncharacterized protein YdeI (YjbR/CyaY-like superfamily)
VINPTHFASARAFRRWLEKNHATAPELLLGFYKVASGRGGLTYPEAVDELLCFGWIDGVKRRVDNEVYTHRITPRRPGSTWSLVNLQHVARLTKAGRMHAAGLKAHAGRLEHKTGIYSYEQVALKPRAQNFPAALARIFRTDEKAWKFWKTQPPGYQRETIHWVTSAKQSATRERRLDQLMSLSAAGRRVGGK